jgi:hypothetical protein
VAMASSHLDAIHGYPTAQHNGERCTVVRDLMVAVHLVLSSAEPEPPSAQEVARWFARTNRHLAALGSIRPLQETPDAQSSWVPVRARFDELVCEANDMAERLGLPADRVRSARAVSRAALLLAERKDTQHALVWLKLMKEQLSMMNTSTPSSSAAEGAPADGKPSGEAVRASCAAVGLGLEQLESKVAALVRAEAGTSVRVAVSVCDVRGCA